MQRIDELNLKDVESYTRTKLVVNKKNRNSAESFVYPHRGVFFIFFFVKRVVGGGENVSSQKEMSNQTGCIKENICTWREYADNVHTVLYICMYIRYLCTEHAFAVCT
jgi:hypothetical protein